MNLAFIQNENQSLPIHQATLSETVSGANPQITLNFEYESNSPQKSTASSPESISEMRLKALLKALPAGVVVLDGAGKVNECNPAAIQLLGEPLLGELWLDVINRAFNPFIASGQDVVTTEGRIVSISTCPLGENLPGQIVLLQDVTDNRKLQTRLEQKERLAAMGEMAAQLAHQIRTPIASALLYASHLKRSHLSEEHRIRFADKILNRIKNLEHLIKDMLLFSKNGMENNSSLSVIELFNELQYSLQLETSVQVNYQNCLSKDSYIFGNHNLLLSSLINLIENAIQATQNQTDERPRQVTLELSQNMLGTIDFKVIDTGCGIEKTELGKIFEPFYTTKSEGTGLGLAVVKAIAHGHKGELWIEKTDSTGSTFVLRLPQQIREVSQAEQNQQFGMESNTANRVEKSVEKVG